MRKEKGQRPTTLSLIGRAPDASYYVDALRGRRGPVLVLGCADGRIAWEIAEAGFETTAVDPSALMIEAAESRREGASEDARGRMHFVSADLRSLRLNQRFPVLIAPQNALGLLATHEDLSAFWSTARHHLEEGGALLFDVATPPAPVLGAALPENEEDFDDPSAPVAPERPIFAPHLRERRREKGTKSAGGIRRLRLRHFTAEEVDQSLSESGFLSLERFGDFRGGVYDDESTLQVVTAVLDTRPSLKRED